MGRKIQNFKTALSKTIPWGNATIAALSTVQPWSLKCCFFHFSSCGTNQISKMYLWTQNFTCGKTTLIYEGGSRVWILLHNFLWGKHFIWFNKYTKLHSQVFFVYISPPIFQPVTKSSLTFQLRQQMNFLFQRPFGILVNRCSFHSSQFAMREHETKHIFLGVLLNSVKFPAEQP